MRISKIKLINWKNFTKAEVDLAYRVFIIGPNACGKSNFLDAIRFLRDIVRQGGSLQEAVQLRDGVSSIRCTAARKNSDVTIGIVLNDISDNPEWEYELSFNQTGGGITDLKAIIKREYLRNLRTGKIFIDRKKDSEPNEYLLGFTHIEQATINKDFQSFVEFLNEISYLHLIPQLIREPNSFLKIAKGEDYYGRDFFDRINKLNQKTRDSYIRKIEKLLRIVVPQLERLVFITDEKGIPHFEATFSQWRPHGVKQIEKHFSDGTLRFIGLFWALLDGNKTLLLEEPELSLHTAVISQLADVIYQFQKRKNTRRQVIVTTHSYDLLNNKGISAEEVILIIPEGREGSAVHLSARLPEIKALLQSENLSIADAVVHRTAPTDARQLSLFNGL
ncbi:MAG: AAA family ATPase [Bacteroidales bacterium]